MESGIYRQYDWYYVDDRVGKIQITDFVVFGWLVVSRVGDMWTIELGIFRNRAGTMYTREWVVYR